MVDKPNYTVSAAAARFYSDLQALETASREDALAFLPIAEQRVEEHREIVAKLTALLDRAQTELDRWAVTAGQLRSTLHPDQAPVGAALRGKQISEIAIAVLEQSGKQQPIHYTDWYELVRLAGYTINGTRPEASFLTALHRHRRVQPIGNRTGLWRLTGGDA